jgi:hypothetical protein
VGRPDGPGDGLHVPCPVPLLLGDRLDARLQHQVEVDGYLSPLFSPLIAPGWLPWFISPGLLILWIPLGFRATCYYYRKAYYRFYFADPPGCAVGEPTAGWIIFTGGQPLIDGSSVRTPFIRIQTLSGEDMEGHPRPVDVEVARQLGESETGTDAQLAAAVQTLLGQIDAARSARTH